MTAVCPVGNLVGKIIKSVTATQVKQMRIHTYHQASAKLYKHLVIQKSCM